MDKSQNMKGLERREATKMDREAKDKMFLLMLKAGQVKPKANGLYVTGRGGREVGAQED